jgi:hypothetical protein
MNYPSTKELRDMLKHAALIKAYLTSTIVELESEKETALYKLLVEAQKAQRVVVDRLSVLHSYLD